MHRVLSMSLLTPQSSQQSDIVRMACMHVKRALGNTAAACYLMKVAVAAAQVRSTSNSHRHGHQKFEYGMIQQAGFKVHCEERCPVAPHAFGPALPKPLTVTA